MGLLKINYITRLTLAEWLVSIILMKKFFYFLALLFISLSASFQSAHANIVINAVLTDEKNSHDSPFIRGDGPCLLMLDVRQAGLFRR